VFRKTKRRVINKLPAIVMEKLIDTLLIFNKLYIEIGNRTIAMLKAESYDSKKANSLGPDMSILNSLMDMNIIDSCSFLDEYEKYFGVNTEEKYKNKILEVKAICKPIIKQIKKWKDLRLVRNSFLVHNLRTRDNKMIFRREINFDAPRGIFEVELLSNLILLLFEVIEKEFKVELEYVKKNFKVNISPFKGFTKDDCWKILDKVTTELNNNLKIYNRKYQINI